VKFFSNLSLRRKVMLLTALCLVIGAGGLSYPGMRATSEATDMMLEDRLTTANVVANSIDEFLALSLTVLKDVAGKLVISEQPEDLENKIKDAWEMYPLLSIDPDSFYIVDGAGHILQSVPALPDISSEKSAAFANILEEAANRSDISSLTTSPVTGNPVVLLCTPVTTTTGVEKVSLVLAMDLDRSGIPGLLQPLRLGDTGYTEVVDENGVVILRTKPGPQITPFESSDHSGHFSELIRTGKPTRGLCHTCHIPSQTVVKRDVLAFMPLTSVQWGVVIRQSEAEAMAPIRRLRLQLWLSVFALVFVALVVTGFATRNVVDRIKKLTSVSSRIADGDLDSPVTSSSSDEIGTLAGALEDMRSKLKTSYSEIERRTGELSSLLSISEILSSVPGSSGSGNALVNAVERATEVIGADAGGVLLNDEEKQAYVYTIAHGFSKQYENTASYIPGRGPIGEAINSGRVMVENDPVRCADVRIDEGPDSQPVKTVVAIPLSAKNQILGILVLASLKRHEYSPEEIRLVEGIARYMSAALENARLQKELQAKEEMRGELLQGVLSVQEEERRRIARELHDETAQVLASLNANIQAALGSLHTDTEKAENLLKKVQSMSVGVLENMNKLIYQLRPSLLDDLGLVAAIRWLGNNNLKPAGIKVSLKTTGRGRRLSREVETSVFRVVQEAFNNIVRHSHAKKAMVTLHFDDGSVVLDIKDDGVGFDFEAAIRSKERPRGLGLLGMNERVELIGGKINVSSSSQGTQIHIEIPQKEEVKVG